MSLPTLNKHSDWLDAASELEMAFTESSVNQISAMAKQSQLPRPDGTYEFTDCEECGNEIGEGRLAAAPKNLLCIHCATLSEKRNKEHNQ